MDWGLIGPQPLINWSSTNDVYGSAPFVVVQHRQPCMVFDPHARCLYRLPVHKHPSVLANEFEFRFCEYSRKMLTKLVLTKTHVIAVHVYGWSSNMHTLVQAFVTPESAIPLDGTGVGELRLTHEVVIPTGSPSFCLLRNSVLDLVTGSVTVRLLRVTNNHIDRDQKDMSCLSPTLPKPLSTTDVLPISIHSQHLFECACTSVRYTASDDGYVRGLLLTEPGDLLSDDFSARKFSIDASGEECIVAISDHSCLVSWPEERGGVAFDGARGRVHYLQTANHVNEFKVVTVDLA